MAELIASGTTEANSADFTLAAGSSTTLYLKRTSGPGLPADAEALVQIKSGTEYFTVGRLTSAAPAQVLSATGTFRVKRMPAFGAHGTTPLAYGVDRD